VFDIVENAKSAADAVLMEEATWKVVSADAELGPQLKTVYRSEELPRDLVVLFRPNAGALDVEKTKAALKQTDRPILDSIRVEAFVDVDKERLAKAEALFHGK
jgi:F420-dependent methylenetetrahydromethanopterin dehydrogenase